MSADRVKRLEQLRLQGEGQRAALAEDLAALRRDFEGRRAQLRWAGGALTAMATTGTVLYKIFARSSLAYQAGRIASAAGVLFQLGRAAFRIKRSW